MNPPWRTTFVGIGVQKSASTWLHEVLSDHPSVLVSNKKELDFFSYFWDRGFDWYHRQFPENADRRFIAAGETSPSYFHCADAPRHVKKYNPDIRIVLSLRDPVTRAYSNHVHDIRQGFLLGPDLSFETGLANNPAYVEQGMYATHFKRWLSEFDSKQILVVLQEDIVENPSAVARAMYEFVGVDPDYQSSIINKRSNERQAVKNIWLAKNIDRLRSISVDSGHGLNWIWASAKMIGLKKLYRKFNVVPAHELIPPMKPETEDLLRTQFRAEIEELETLIGRSLRHWRVPSSAKPKHPQAQ